MINSSREELLNKEGSRFTLFPHFQWKSFILFCSALALAVFYVVSTSDLFNIPTETTESYVAFKRAKDRYESNQLYWDLQQRYLIDEIKRDIAQTGGRHTGILLQDATGEMIISYLLKEIGVPPERLETLAISPKQTPSTLSFIISKLDQGVWPLEIILTLEIELSFESGKPKLLFTRLRRGNQDLATGLTWAYFGSDLEWFKNLGIVSIKASQGNVF